MYEAAEALRDAMLALGLACDGGKDSVSMVARAGDEVPALPWRTACVQALNLIEGWRSCGTSWEARWIGRAGAS